MKILKFLGMVLLSLLAVVFSIGLGVWYFVLGVHFGEIEVNKFSNSIWLRHAWLDDDIYLEQIPSLVENLQRRNMDYAYVHSGPLDEQALIEPNLYRNAAVFLRRARELDQEIKYYAWIGQVRSKIDLENESVQKNMIETARILTEEVGFDGIHIDIEPIRDQDEAFLLMIEKLRAVHKGIKLSVAVNKFVPGFVPSLVNIAEFNTKNFYQRLDKVVDQIVVMTYDTRIQSPVIYSWFVEQQVVYLGKIVFNSDLFIGVPTYSYDEREKENFPDFYEDAENIESGLRGVIEGLRNVRTKDKTLTGIAIYSYWETDDEEWRVYDELWNESSLIK